MVDLFSALVRHCFKVNPAKRWNGLRTFYTPHLAKLTTNLNNVNDNSKIAKKLTRQNITSFMDSFDTMLIDCDGVLWGTDHRTKFSGIDATISKLLSHKKQLLFVTNNSMLSTESCLHKFKEMVGFHADPATVFCVAHAAALYLKQNLIRVQGKVYLIGTPGMAEELDKMGVAHFGVGPDPDEPTRDPSELVKHELFPDVGAVLVGFDEHFHYNKLFKATSYLSRPDCLYVVTSTLETKVRIGTNHVQPVTGPLVAGVTAAAQREPVIVGKPSVQLLNCVQSRYPLMEKSRTMMVGDGLHVDIAFAKNAGIDSLLVLTGSSSMGDVQGPADAPTYYAESFADIGRFFS